MAVRTNALLDVVMTVPWFEGPGPLERVTHYDAEVGIDNLAKRWRSGAWKRMLMARREMAAMS
jgi:hypothetical protein